MSISRRSFLTHGALALGALSVSLPTLSHPLDRHVKRQPIGLQLYSLGDAVTTNTAVVMAQLAEDGYEELEAVTYTNFSARELRRQVDAAGLKLRSAHLDFAGSRDVSRLFDTAHQLGVRQVVSSVLSPSADIDSDTFVGMTSTLVADDFKRIAARANHIAELAKRAGLQYAYHNHNFEFRALSPGIIGYDILLNETDKDTVQFEADCGWMSAAGKNPVDYLRHNPGRYRAIHVKNFDAIGFSTQLDQTSLDRVVELSRGVIDYQPILKAALDTGVKHFFVEHDPKNGVPIPMTEVEREGRYLRSLFT